MKVVTRIAPSPTGQMHIGTVRTALFNYLFAKQHGGTYFVRIEDTDKERNKPEWTEQIWSDFSWVGLPWDRQYIQSEHLAFHQSLLRSLVEKGAAYVSKEPSRDDATREVEVVRLKNPQSKVAFNDLIRGEVSFDTTELGDFVIARSLDDPLYHFAVVVDDHEAGVTHVIRAEEHLSNTPRQILILEALGFERPQYAHIPLILAPDRSKLSKRKHNVSLENYKNAGYLPQGIINYLALLGWNPGTEEEFFDIENLIKRFSLEQVQKSGAIFDENKMRWFNREHMLRMSPEAFWEYAQPFLSERTVQNLSAGRWRLVVPVMLERASTFGDIRDADEAGEYRYYYEAPDVSSTLIVPKGETAMSTLPRIERAVSLLSVVHAEWTAEQVKAALWDYATEEGRGKVLWPIRTALSGKEKSPDPFTIAGIIGRDETLARLGTACNTLRANTERIC